MPGVKSSLLVVFFVAVVLRIYGLFAYDLWFDEIGTKLFSYQSIHRMAELSHVAPQTIFQARLTNDSHSFLYYHVVYFFSQFLGEGKALRLLSLVFSVLTVGVFYRVARILLTPRASFYALIILALNPFHIWYAQEARVYAMAGFVSLLMVYAFLTAVRDNRWWQWLAVGVSGAAAMMTSYFNIFILALLPVYLKLRGEERSWRPWLIAMAVTAALCAPAVPLVTAQWQFVQGNFWLPEPTPLTALFTVLVFILGYSGFIFQYAAGLVVFGVLAGWGTYHMAKADPGRALFLGLLVILPPAVIYVISHHSTPVYIHRQMLIFSPYLYFLAARGIEALPEERDRRVALGCVVLLMLSCLVNYYRNAMFDHKSRAKYFTGVVPKKNYQQTFRQLEQNFREGDIVAATETQAFVMLFAHVLDVSGSGAPLQFGAFKYYLFPSMMQRFDNRFLRIQDIMAQIPESEINRLQTFVPAPNGALVIDDDPVQEQPFNRVWLMSASWDNKGDQEAILNINALQVRSLFDRLFHKKSTQINDGIYLELYEK